MPFACDLYTHIYSTKGFTFVIYLTHKVVVQTKMTILSILTIVFIHTTIVTSCQAQMLQLPRHNIPWQLIVRNTHMQQPMLFGINYIMLCCKCLKRFQSRREHFALIKTCFSVYTSHKQATNNGLQKAWWYCMNCFYDNFMMHVIFLEMRKVTLYIMLHTVSLTTCLLICMLVVY